MTPEPRPHCEAASREEKNSDRTARRQAVLCGLCVETEEKNAKFAKQNLAKFAKKEDETFYP